MKKFCCFTGHRPQKLPWRFNELDLRFIKTKQIISLEIKKAIQNGYNCFLTGMALGFDTMCAEIVLEFKKFYDDIELICVLPCKNQEKFWKEKDKLKYFNILKNANKITYLEEFYTKKCMQDRNEYLINNSSLVISLFDGSNGGTKNTLKYAQQCGKEIVIIEPIKSL